MIGCAPRKRCATAIIVLLASFAGGASSQPPAHGGSWEDRLADLRPAQPFAYFELAEEIADQADRQEMRDLGRHLFALAGILDPIRLGRSSCLALADLAETPLERRRLLMMASLLSQPAEARLIGGLLPGHAGVVEPSVALEFCELISFYRRGDGERALTTMQDDAVMTLLQSHARHLPGGERRFIEDCRSYRGSLHPTLMDGEHTRLLRLEAALLAGDDRDWADDLLLGGGAPLVDIDPDQLTETLGVDGTRPYYRQGQWIARPNSVEGGKPD